MPVTLAHRYCAALQLLCVGCIGPGTTEGPKDDSDDATPGDTDRVNDTDTDTDDPGPVTVTPLRIEGAPQALTQTQRLPIFAATCRSAHSSGVTAIDFDGDGLVDLAAPTCDEVYLWRGRGDGSFDAPAILRVGIDPSVLTYGVWFWDFDRDGLPEMIFPASDGLQVLANLGGLRFAPGDRWGIVERRGQAATINFTDLNGDGRADLFMGHTSPDLATVLSTREFVHDEAMDDELYLQDADGRFSPLLAPPAYSWFTLHSVPLEGGIVAFGDFGSESTGSAWYKVEGRDVQANPSSMWINDIEAPMGGLLDWFDGTELLFVSDADPVHVLMHEGQQWFARADLRATFVNGYSWSVLSLEQLRASATVVVTYGGMPVDVESHNPHPRADSVRLFDYVDDTLVSETLTDEASFVGATAADLDGDGLPELIARELLDGGGSAVRIWTARSEAPRVLLQLDVTCLDAVVSTVDRKAHFLPYTNSGTFGHGPLELTLPWPSDGHVDVQAHGWSQRLTVPGNTRVRVSCAAPPASIPLRR